jgi:solute carrier family 25 carnitine/acylcarnitine transporter 20/29
MINSLIDGVSGFWGGVANCVSGFFLDTVKTRMQLNPELKSTWHVLRLIIKSEGVGQLFSGLYYPIITMPIYNSVLFTAYEGYKAATGKDVLGFWNGV